MATTFSTTVTGINGSTSCTATEASVPGYTSTGTCTATLSANGTASCTIVNTLNSATFTVTKDFQPDNGSTSVSISLSCWVNGTVTSSPQGRNGDGDVSFTVTGINGSTSCTATEASVPGYTSTGTCTVSPSVPTVAPPVCTIINTLNSATFTVTKDFVPDNASTSVSISLTCGANGTVTTTPLSRNGDGDVVFTVTGINGSSSCTATEASVPGYTESDDCGGVTLTANGTASCTITNTALGTFLVHKDFSDDYGGPVTVSLYCGTTATVAPPFSPASEALPATFTVTGTDGSTLCTATESGAPGYTSTGQCQATLSTAACTIVNNAVATFQVYKDFKPDNPATVTVSVSCDSGIVSSPIAGPAEGSPVDFTVTGYGPGPQSCTATESPVPAGYTSDSPCSGSIVNHSGSCTITNTLNSATLTVKKVFSDNSGASVMVSVGCTSGTPSAGSPASSSVSHATPGSYAITGFDTGATCTATETVPAGYTETDDCAGVPIAVGGTPPSCTITNTLTSATLTVKKVYSPTGPTASVPVSVLCTNGGTPSPASGNVSPTTDFSTTVTGFTAGAHCTATETVPRLHRQHGMRWRRHHQRRYGKLHDHEHAAQRHLHGDQELRARQRRHQRHDQPLLRGQRHRHQQPADPHRRRQRRLHRHRHHHQHFLHGDRARDARLHDE